MLYTYESYTYYTFTLRLLSERVLFSHQLGSSYAFPGFSKYNPVFYIVGHLGSPMLIIRINSIQIMNSSLWVNYTSNVYEFCWFSHLILSIFASGQFPQCIGGSKSTVIISVNLRGESSLSTIPSSTARSQHNLCAITL